MFADFLPNDCDDTYNIQTNTVCDGHIGKIQLNISDGAFKNVLVNSYGIKNCSTCHNFKQVNFTFHLEKLTHSKGKTCLNGSMDTTTISLTSETSNIMGKSKYFSILLPLSFPLSLSLSFSLALSVN